MFGVRAVQAKVRELERARAADTLKRELGTRSDKENLVARRFFHVPYAGPV